MKFAHIEELTGKILGWYSPEIHPVIPTPNIEIADEVWQNAINNGHNTAYADGTTAQVDYRGCQEVEMSCCAAVNALKTVKFATAAFEWPTASGRFWQTTPDKQAVVTSRATMAVAVQAGIGGEWPGDYQIYRDAGDNDYSFATAADFIPFAVAFSNYCIRIATQACVHKDALMAINNNALLTDAEKMAAMEAYDITLNW